MADETARAYKSEFTDFGADLDDGFGRDVDSVLELGGRGNLGGGVDERGEIVTAKTPVDVGALDVVADGDKDGRAGIVAGDLFDRAENRITLVVVALLPFGIVVGVADDIPLRAAFGRIDAFRSPYSLASEAAGADNKQVSH